MNITYVHRTVKLYSMPNNYYIYILYARNIQAIPTKQINAQLWLLIKTSFSVYVSVSDIATEVAAAEMIRCFSL